jgi:hypothetical protein
MMSGIHPFRVLRAGPLRITNGVVTGVLAPLFAALYVGADVDPTWERGSPSRSPRPSTTTPRPTRA